MYDCTTVRLYDYYKTLPEKKLPGTLEEMHPLFCAVAHGCAVGLHQKALDEIYWPRIQRKKVYFMHKKLCAFSDDLAVLTHFFTTPRHTPAASLTDREKAVMLSRAGFCLRALGRLREALEPIQEVVDNFVRQKNYHEAAINASNLSELQLTLGDIAAAVISAQQSVDYADEFEDLFWHMVSRTNYANALHQAGETAQALELFIEADQLQRELQPNYPRLYSLRGFLYSDLLLAQDEVITVLERAEYALNISLTAYEKSIINMGLFDIALDQLTLGRAHCQQGDFPQAIDWLDQAIAGLRAARQQDYLPRGLLARAALNRDTRNPKHDFAPTRQNLQEAYDIAEPSDMRLHLTDYHLEMVRLLLADQECGVQPPEEIDGWKALTLHEHVAEAVRLIIETGHKRRLPELKELQSKIEM